MLKCPECGCEYQQGYQTCSDCKCELIEVPESSSVSTKYFSQTFHNIIHIIIFILGLILIFNAPIFSRNLAHGYFFPGGNGVCDPDQLMAMTQGYLYSLLLIGFLVCLPCILYWYKKQTKISTD